MYISSEVALSDEDCGLGAGFASCTYFLLLMATGSHRTAVRLDAIFWVALNWAAEVRR